jgi:hypothetical protein
MRADLDIDQQWAREASDRLAAYRRGELPGQRPERNCRQIPLVTVRFLEIAEVELDEAIDCTEPSPLDWEMRF